METYENLGTRPLIVLHLIFFSIVAPCEGIRECGSHSLIETRSSSRLPNIDLHFSIHRVCQVLVSHRGRRWSALELAITTSLAKATTTCRWCLLVHGRGGGGHHAAEKTHPFLIRRCNHLLLKLIAHSIFFIEIIVVICLDRMSHSGGWSTIA